MAFSIPLVFTHTTLIYLIILQHLSFIHRRYHLGMAESSAIFPHMSTNMETTSTLNPRVRSFSIISNPYPETTFSRRYNKKYNRVFTNPKIGYAGSSIAPLIVPDISAPNALYPRWCDVKMDPVFNRMQKTVKAQRWGRPMPESPDDSPDSEAEDIEEEEDAGSVDVEGPSPPIYYDDDEDENVVHEESNAESHVTYDNSDADEDEDDNAMTAEMEARNRSIDDDDSDETEDTVTAPVQRRRIHDGVNQSDQEPEEAHVQEDATAIEPQSCSIYNEEPERPEDSIRVFLPYSSAAAAIITPAPPVQCLYNNWNAQPIFMVDNIPCDHPPTNPRDIGRAVPFDAFAPRRSNGRNTSPGGVSVPGLTTDGQYSPSNNTSGPSSYPDCPEQSWIEDVNTEEQDKQEEERERQAWLKRMPLLWRLVNTSSPDDTPLSDGLLPLDLDKDLWTAEQRIAVCRFVGQGLWGAIGREVGR